MLMCFESMSIGCVTVFKKKCEDSLWIRMAALKLV